MAEQSDAADSRPNPAAWFAKVRDALIASLRRTFFTAQTIS